MTIFDTPREEAQDRFPRQPYTNRPGYSDDGTMTRDQIDAFRLQGLIQKQLEANFHLLPIEPTDQSLMPPSS